MEENCRSRTDSYEEVTALKCCEFSEAGKLMILHQIRPFQMTVGEKNSQ